MSGSQISRCKSLKCGLDVIFLYASFRGNEFIYFVESGLLNDK